MPYPCRHISLGIRCDADAAYRFAANPRNLPRWASGLSNSSIREENGAWIADSPMGEVRVAFAPENTYGILDHDVTLPDGTCFYNPMRVFRNGDGCEVVFSLLEQAPMTPEEREKDAATIAKDLHSLKAILENEAD